MSSTHTFEQTFVWNEPLINCLYYTQCFSLLLEITSIFVYYKFNFQLLSVLSSPWSESDIYSIFCDMKLWHEYYRLSIALLIRIMSLDFLPSLTWLIILCIHMQNAAWRPFSCSLLHNFILTSWSYVTVRCVKSIFVIIGMVHLPFAWTAMVLHNILLIVKLHTCVPSVQNTAAAYFRNVCQR
jgi:hypothetical protein